MGVRSKECSRTSTFVKERVALEFDPPRPNVSLIDPECEVSIDTIAAPFFKCVSGASVFVVMYKRNVLV